MPLKQEPKRLAPPPPPRRRQMTSDDFFRYKVLVENFMKDLSRSLEGSLVEIERRVRVLIENFEFDEKSINFSVC